MIFRNTAGVNRHFGSKLLNKLVIPLLALIALSGLFVTPVSAQSVRPERAVGYYTQNGQTFWLTPGKNVTVFPPGTSPSDIEAMFPMSPSAEKAIIHQIPPCPVVVDGVKYDAKDISLFDGVRLRFITGKDGALYAFTTARGLEQFQQSGTGVIGQSISDSIFYKDWLFGGDRFSLSPGCGFQDLSQIGFDNCISSVQVGASSWAYLFDYAYYAGDYFAMQPGSNHSALTFEGWNDRATSVYVSQ